MNVVSYNLRKNRALCELDDLTRRTDPDVLCLQECDIDSLPTEIGSLRLAEATRGNRLGISVFYRADRFRLIGSQTYQLKKSLHDRVAAPAHERLVATRLMDLTRDRELMVASFHGAPLTALNSLRRNQIRTSFERLAQFGAGLPSLMVGDYNYPFFQRHLQERVRTHGYELTATEQRTYQRYRIFRGRYDMATSTGFTVNRVTSLPQGLSDHHPILVNASYDDSMSATATLSSVAPKHGHGSKSNTPTTFVPSLV